ncbi:MAG: hypothetical protein WC323_00795 [Patescibacteria group bacterium]|jgi:hypothetical protein
MEGKGEVNFLPEELKSKNPKKPKAKKEEVEFSNPKGDLVDLKKEDKKTKGGLWSIFKSKKTDKDNSGEEEVRNKFSRPVLKKSDINRAREELLRKIKEKQQPGEKNAVKNKIKIKTGIFSSKDKKNIPNPAGDLLKNNNPRKSLFAVFSGWLQKRKARKQEKKQMKAMRRKMEKEKKAKDAEVKKLAKQGKKEELLKTKKPSVPESYLPAENKAKEAVKDAPKKERKNLLITNLIKGQESTFFNWSQAAAINIISIIFFVLIIAGSWVYLDMEEKKIEDGISSVAGNIAAKQAELINLKKEMGGIDGLREKIGAAKTILDNHIYWTNFFSYLENNTLPGVYYSEFSGDLSGEYAIPAGTEEFRNFISQMENWQQENEYTIAATSGGAEINKSGGQDAVSFELELKVKPEIFLKK